MKLRIVIKRPFGNIELEGKSIDEIVESLRAFPEWLDIIDKLVLKAALQEPSAEMEETLSGLVVFSKDGPLVSLSREEVSDKEAIALILYAQGSEKLEPKEVGRVLELSGRPSAGFGARLSEMRREGLVVKEDGSYKLSVIGERWIEDMIKELKERR